ncbi:hypothetical protein EHS25_007479 [Saitozyma podzolica]|uniref:YMC020W-like alpha/beta hydrolase domain-containing protein n=1 Tax=Saitozyma podzolica TaxID=1890683 RepID=A0A427YQ03_9TREE|nr:hypothetical protein EHS25_007479 [Saitozyma podzolica]
MSSTPRKSSVASRTSRPPGPAPIPASLRLASAARKASNPRLTLVFAQGDSSLPPSTGAPPGTSGSGPGSSSRSEEALSRQLDGDLGGRQMGLRSRRSSSATVRTMRTISGLRDGSPSPSVQEEDEDGILGTGDGERNAQAGPSTKRTASSSPLVQTPVDEVSDPQQTLQPHMTRSLNPKSSTSWLRWNSPAPSFPRSANKGKGKGKAQDIFENGGNASAAPSTASETANGVPVPTSAGTYTGNDLAVPLQQDGTATEPPLQERPGEPAIPEQAQVLKTAQQPQPAQATQPAQSSPSTETLPNPQLAEPAHAERSAQSVPHPPTSQATNSTSLPAKRSWWGRSAPPAPPVATSFQPPPPRPSQVMSGPAAGDSDGDQSVAVMEGTAIAESKPSPILTIPNGGEAVPAEVKQPVEPVLQQAAEPSSRPVEEVLQDTVESKPTQPPEAASVTATPEASVGGGGWRQVFGWRTTAQAPPQSDKAANGDARPAPIAEVTTEPRAPLSQEIAEPSVPENASALPASPPPAPVQPAAELSSTASPNTTAEANPGWGTYLYSFVSNPKPVPKPSTPPTTASALPSDTIAESQSVSTPQPALAIQAATPVPTPSAPEGLSVPVLAGTPIEGQATTSSSRTASPVRKGSVASTSGWLNYLALRAQKRLPAPGSVGTGETEGRKSSETHREEVMDFSNDPDFPVATPAAPVPAAQDGTDQSKPTVPAPAPAGKTLANKSSQLSVRKKRLSMSSTRSGGSLTPLSSSPKHSTLDGKVPGSTRSTSSTAVFFAPGAGITAKTTGLAWRAIAAAGTYVYGGHPAPGPDSVPENDKEVRERKDGRRVGGELPRRVGLGHGAVDDGWKHVKRVAVVGVHGWFPAKMLNSVIGEPTGTSVKFANMMGSAVKKFFEDKGVTDIRLTLMPLEGEGTIDHRVDKLYKAYLSNPAWINDLRRADAIFFAAHSQGCIVTTHLISRMIAQGHIRTPLNREAVGRCEWAFGPIGLLPPEEPRRGRKPFISTTGSEGGYQKVAMLAMCGVHLGPLHSISTSTVIQPYLQWFENAAARELFEFQDTNSAVSLAYQRALGMVLENEVRVLLLASLNDQVVPIYGASFSTAQHPLLLRALFVDGASYSASDFMTNLLCFAFMLRNAGIDDQRLVEHLSEATAGSLTGVGHSSPYEEAACYSLIVDYLFHSTPARQPMPALHVESFSARDARNDFELPWIMRALVDAPEVKDLFPGELRDLKEGILHWKPTTKALREIKRRLEPMAGRQSRLRPLPNSPSSTSLNAAAEQGSNGATPGGSTGKAAAAALSASVRKDW